VCDDSWNQILSKGLLSDVAIAHQQQAAKGSDGVVLEENRKEGSLNVTLSGGEAALGLTATATMHVTTNNLVLEPFHWADRKTVKLHVVKINASKKADLEAELDEKRNEIAELDKTEQMNPNLPPPQLEQLKKQRDLLTRNLDGIMRNLMKEKSRLDRAEQELALLEIVKGRENRIPTWEVKVNVKRPPSGVGATSIPDDLQVKLAFGDGGGTDVVFSPVNDKSASGVDEPSKTGEHGATRVSETGEKQ